MRSGVLERLQLLHDSQFWPYERLRDYQDTRVRELISYAYEHVPYYSDLMRNLSLEPEDIRGAADLPALPVLTRSAALSAGDSLWSRAVGTARLQTNSTGGSLGVPLRFGHSDEYLIASDAARLRAWYTAYGLDYRDVQGVWWGAVRDVGRSSPARSLARLLRHGSLTLNTYDLEDASLLTYARLHSLVRPSSVRGYSSSLVWGAQRLGELGIQLSPPAVVIASAETLRPDMRQIVEDYFRAPVVDSYGCREVSQIATECLEARRLHVVMENQVVELVPDEATGLSQVVVTNLHNRAFPFIRYQVGDLAEGLTVSRCTCGRESATLSSIAGRASDVMTLSNGKTIHALAFCNAFYDLPGVRQFQVVFSSRTGRVRLDVIEDGSLDSEQLDKRIAQARESLAFDGLTWAKVADIDPGPTGKVLYLRIQD